MKLNTPLRLGCAVLAAGAMLASAAPAQFVVETSGMTVPHSFIDMDTLPLGNTTVAALNAAGSNGGATMANFTTAYKGTSSSGIYNTQTCGQALCAASASGGTQLAIIDDFGAATFDPFTASIDLGGPSTEFGLLIGDWIGPAILNFYSGGSLLYTHTSSTFTTCGTQYYQMVGGTFDRVDLDVSTISGNWVIMELYIEGLTGPSVVLNSAGSCPGPMTFTASGATPGGQVVFVWGRPGVYAIPPGRPCAGGLLALKPLYNPPPGYVLVTADPNGVASTSGAVPGGACGALVMQALDLSTCQTSNVLLFGCDQWGLWNVADGGAQNIIIAPNAAGKVVVHNFGLDAVWVKLGNVVVEVLGIGQSAIVGFGAGQTVTVEDGNPGNRLGAAGAWSVKW